MSNNTQLQAIGNFSVEELKTMQETIATGTTPAQFNLFARTAAASGLNPFLNHIFAIVYQGKMSLQISVEGIVYLAKKVEGYQGIDAQVVCENDEFKASRAADGEWIIEKHDVMFPRGKTIAAYAVAYREGFRPFTVLMDVDEVEHFKTSSIANQATMWKKYFNDMFKKHVIKRAAKGQFGIEVSEDDAPVVGGSADNIPAYQPERRDITAEVEQAATEQKQEQPKAEPTQSEDKDKKNMERLGELFKQLGYTKKGDKDKYINEKLNGKQLTTTNIIGLIQIMEAELEAQSQLADIDDELLTSLD